MTENLEEMAHVITVAGKSNDRLYASGDPGNAGRIVQDFKSFRTQGGCSKFCNPKAGKPKILMTEAPEEDCSSSQGETNSPSEFFLSRSQVIG